MSYSRMVPMDEEAFDLISHMGALYEGAASAMEMFEILEDDHYKCNFSSDAHCDIYEEGTRSQNIFVHAILRRAKASLGKISDEEGRP